MRRMPAALADQIAERLPKGQEKFVDDEEFVYFFHLDSFYRAPRPDWGPVVNHFKQQTVVLFFQGEQRRDVTFRNYHYMDWIKRPGMVKGKDIVGFHHLPHRRMPA